jgi:hypothetical protein
MAPRVPGADDARMVKRIVAAPLWFVSVWLMYGLVAYFLGLPDTGGAVLGALVAALICLDPAGAFWGHKERRAPAAAPDPVQNPG